MAKCVVCSEWPMIEGQTTKNKLLKREDELRKIHAVEHDQTNKFVCLETDCFLIFSDPAKFLRHRLKCVADVSGVLSRMFSSSKLQSANADERDRQWVSAFFFSVLFCIFIH